MLQMLSVISQALNVTRNSPRFRQMPFTT